MFVFCLIITISEAMNLSMETANNMYNVYIITMALVIIYVLIMSIYNYILTPPKRIFINYEQHLRAILTEYFKQKNEECKNKLVFSVSENPNNALWIEIHIMDRDLRMPFDEKQIEKHVEHLQKVSDEENKDLEREKIHLHQIVMH